MTPLAYLHGYALPSAYALLPAAMASPKASALLLAIALQESRCAHRRQIHGPARGFWQFERGGGVAGVLSHAETRPLIEPVLAALAYPVSVDACYDAIEHHDILAACFARLLLWTLPQALPSRENSAGAWTQYTRAWRPGKPHRETWDALYAMAWDTVQAA
jgi:hypothetical protein